MPIRPVEFLWDGDVLIPNNRFRPLCNRQFVVGERYVMVPLENRSLKSHNHYFACVHAGWNNLPEDRAREFPTPEHLRKWCLVRCGYYSETNYVLGSNRDARTMATAIRRADEYAVIVVSKNTVKVYVASTQSMAAMKKDEFQASKIAVLDMIASMIGFDAEQLKLHAAEKVPRPPDDSTKQLPENPPGPLLLEHDK